ncbi:terminase small subunit [Heliomarina baculiformis]|uniref:terminase small subunit n=1 Tax=Heliomarina baculiformis TaxID=2872036 RepID=UPI001EE1BCCE|nr:terminase small subunit [Heliomarina baculiformis]
MIEAEETSTEWLGAFGLNPRQRQFVLTYLKKPNATRAALEIGYKHPNVQGPRLLKHDKVARALTAGRKKLESVTMLDAQKIVKQWSALAMADVTELVQHVHRACRYCHGTNHQFQWRSAREYDAELTRVACELFPDDKALENRDLVLAGNHVDPRLPSKTGGFGFRANLDPHPNCPECGGYGVEKVEIADTRLLSPAARLLLDGIQETPQGKKLRIRSRDKALMNLARHLGLFDHKKPADREREILQETAERIMANATTVPVVRH